MLAMRSAAFLEARPRRPELAVLCCSSQSPVLLLPQRDLSARRRGDHAAPPRRALPRRQQHLRPQLARPLGGLVDPVDRNLRQPQRSTGATLDPPAAEIAAEVERVVATRWRIYQLLAPIQQLRVESTRAAQIPGVQL